MGTELATAYLSLVPSFKGGKAAIAKEFGGGGSQAAASTESAFKRSTGRIGTGFKSMFQTAAVAGAGVLAGVGLIGGGLYKIGSDFDEASDTIRVATGKTGMALAGLNSDFKAVVQDVPASFADASAAVGDLNTRVGLTGKPLRGLSSQFLELSRLTGVDLKTNIASTTRVFGDWQISAADMPATLDKIFRASQASGIGIDKLTESVVQVGAPLRNLGFGFDESLALLAQFDKAGVNTNTVFAGLKAGVGKLAKAGEDVPDTFRRVVGEITKMGPGTEATAKAIELFGQRAGPDLADAIAGGKFSTDAMLKSITGGTDTIRKAGKDTADFGEKWTLIKNRVFVALQPIASRVFDAIGSGMDKLGPIAGTLFAGLRQGFNLLFRGDFTGGGPFAEDSPFVDNMLKLRVTFQTKIIPAVKSAFTQVRDAVTGAITWLRSVDWAKVFNDAKAFVTPIVEAVSKLAGTVIRFAVAAWPQVVDAFNSAKPTLTTIATVVRNTVAAGVRIASSAIALLTRHIRILKPILLTTAAAFAGYKAAKTAASGIRSVTSAFRSMGSAASKAKGFLTKAGTDGYSKIDKLRLGFMRAREAGSKLWGGVKSGASKLADYGKTAASAAKDIAKTTAAWVAQKVALLAAKAQQVALTVAQKAAALAQWALNAAMNANPVSLIVLALAALVAGLVLAYKKVGWFHDFVDAAFRGIKTVVGAVVGFIRKHWQLLLAILTGPIGLAVLAIVKNWDKIKAGFRAVKSFIGARVSDIVGFIRGIPGRIRAVVSTMWDGLKNGIRLARNFVRNRFNDIVGFVKGIPARLKSIADRLKDALLAPFKAAFKAVAGLWNSTIGKLSFEIPSWVPSIGGKSWNVPDIDTDTFDKYHSGGRLRRIPGRTGEEVPFIGLAGERVLSIPQTRAWESAMARRGGDSGTGWGGWVFQGPVTFGDSARQTVRDLRLFSMAQGQEVARS
jgi:phage-related protein